MNKECNYHYLKGIMEGLKLTKDHLENETDHETLSKKLDDELIRVLALMPEDPKAKSYNAEEIGELFNRIKGI